MMLAPEATKWTVIGVNEGARALIDPDGVGLSTDGPVGECLPRALASAVEAMATEARDGNTNRAGYVSLTPDGGVAFTIIPLMDPPQALCLLRHRRALPVPDQAVSAGLYRTLVETIPNPLFYKDRDGRYLGCNSAFAALYGIPTSRIGEKIVGRTLFDLQPADIAEVNEEYDRLILSQAMPTAYEAQVVDGRGTMKDVLVSKAPFRDDEGQVGGVVGMLIDITDRKQNERELLRQATTDMITGANNRRQFITLAVRELNRSRRYRHPISVALMDIDFFKKINDTYGHAIGDQALKAVADICTTTLRDTDVFGRIGGEEFASILPLTDMDTGRLVGERLRRAVEELVIETSAGPVQLTISIGIVVSEETHNPLVDDLMIQADEALYEAKRSGRNKVVIRAQR